MKKLMLVSQGRFRTTEEIVTPSNVGELLDDVIRVAQGHTPMTMARTSLTT